jgi:sec-independent protein translocase protein TatA
MLGLENPLHIVFLLVLLLLVFGAKRLPEMGKSLGTGLRGFKDSLSGETPDHDSRPTSATPVLGETPQPATSPHLAVSAGVEDHVRETAGAPR